MNILKSIGAIAAGFITVAILSTATDFILESLGIFPPISSAGLFIPWMLVVALLYRSLFTIIGGYVTALLAPHHPMRHVMILAVIGLVAGIAGTIAGWNLSQHWYPIALAVTGPFFVVWGGKMKKEKISL